MSFGVGDDHALIGISVAAGLTGVNPPMLRTYEAKGLLQPYRTDGGTRLYSSDDIARIRRITTLLAAGLNLAGVEQVLALEEETERLRGEIDDLSDQLGRRPARRTRNQPGGPQKQPDPGDARQWRRNHRRQEQR